MRGRRHKLQVSTFPFLAVLLCAMGSLILVLLVMDRKAHRAAQARAQREAARLVEENAQSEKQRQAERERMEQESRAAWEKKRDDLHDKLSREQIEMQLQMRKVREQLQQIAARLHYEQDTSTQLRRKTQDQRSRLEAEEQLLRTLHSNAKQTEEQSKESSQALRRMTLDLLQMEQVLKDLKAARQREQKTFSVVPYHGRRGENRRPLYVECCAEGVIFHPERKAMSLSALLPGYSDPASDVRAEVERRIARQGQKLASLPANAIKTPYLLLLLRPSGVATYILFQRALKGLDVDFGYEFIDNDWVLDFPADDELPSTQPWMIATKTPARPAPAPAAAASPPRRTNDHLIGMVQLGGTGGVPAPGIRGFRGIDSVGSGNGARGPANQTGGYSGGKGGDPGGSGSAIAGGAPATQNTVASSAMPGGSGGSGFPGPQSTLGNGGSLFGPSGVPGTSLADSSGNRGVATNSAGPSLGPSRGNGHGHPSAMPPSFLDNEGGMGNSDEGAASGNGYQGTGTFIIGGPYSGRGIGSGPMLAGPGSDSTGLDPPRAISSGSQGGYLGGAMGQSAVAGVASSGNGVPGNGMGGGWPGEAGMPGSGSGMGTATNGPYVVARGNNGGDASSQTFSGAGSALGAGGTGVPGLGNPALNGSGQSAGGSGQFAGGSGQPTGGNGQGTGGSGPLTNGYGQSTGGYVQAAGVPGHASVGPGQATGGNGQVSGAGGPSIGSSGQVSGGVGHSISGSGQVPGVGQSMDGAGQPMSGYGQPASGSNQPALAGGAPTTAGAPGGSGPGTSTASGGAPVGQTAGGAPMPANSGRSADVVIYIDPVTGKPTAPPPQTSPPADAPAEERPPEETDGTRRAPRVRAIVGNGAASGGSYGSGDNESEALNRFAPTPSAGAPPARRLAAPRPLWVHGGRDWTIYIECRGNDLVLYPSQRTFTLAEVVGGPTGNPLIKAIQQMIDRHQSSRRPGEPPYRVQLCLLVRPEHIRTFLSVYPALEAVPVPTTRRNLDADDDVIGIVTGAIP